MGLDSIFTGVASKKLVQVDLPNKKSHQHELNGSRALGRLLGFEKTKNRISWKRFSGDGSIEQSEGDFTWYDARERSSARTGRSEWRFYYSGDFLSRATVGDLLVLAQTTEGQILGLVFAKNSNWVIAASNLFGINPDDDGIQIISRDRLRMQQANTDDPILRVLRFAAPNLSEEFSSSTSTERERPTESEVFKFRPASRLIGTIGQNLIKDPPAAIIELVKNSYDADSSHVRISIEQSNLPTQPRFVRFRVSDDGHGMTRDTVINAWLVPATGYKSEKKYSPNGRRMQGNKGIGRYAAFVLGNELLLKTVDQERLQTTVFLDWTEFQRHEFLDQVPILVETIPSKSDSGTLFEITGTGRFFSAWHEQTIGALRSELRKLISPFRDESDPFTITLQVSGFPEPYINVTETIEALSLVEFFDYRLSGTITEDGTGTFVFQNQVGVGEEPRNVDLQLSIPPDATCGRVEVDLRVYDRDPEAIAELIRRGLHDPETGKELARREARALLDINSGISIFRGDFKIRPYGDPGFDWLELDKQRVQNPSLKIGSNQVIGYVRIQPEEVSHLEEKSARDGLKDNVQFATLRRIVNSSLAELEQRRFLFRKKVGRGRKVIKVDEVVTQLTDFDATFRKIEKVLVGSNVDRERIEAIRRVLDETGRAKEDLIGQIQETIAIYQGQATLGKIIMVLLHEGRKPIGYFRDMAPILLDWIGQLRKAPNDSLLAKLVSRLENAESQASVLTRLFDRLEPLSVRKRHKPRKFPVMRPITRSIAVFQGELDRISATIDIDPRLEIDFEGWEEDFILIFTNLIENSVYWFVEEKSASPEITFRRLDTELGSTIEFSDNGPGISEDLIRDQSIFEPGFSTKLGGTGLGLAIAGEAAERNGCKLKAYYNDSGARFVLELFPGLKSD